MAYYDALTQKWATLSGTTAQKLAAINAATADGPKRDISVSSVVGYLATIGALDTLQTYAATSPAGSNATAVKIARNFLAFCQFAPAGVFQTSDQTHYSAITAQLDELAADATSGVTQATADYLIGLSATSVSWWSANGYTSPIGEGDLQAAGDLT